MQTEMQPPTPPPEEEELEAYSMMYEEASNSHGMQPDDVAYWSDDEDYDQIFNEVLGKDGERLEEEGNQGDFDMDMSHG